MKRGYLSEYFEGVAIKTLSAVEADLTISHQHEYGATKPMQAFMGVPREKVRLPTRFIYLDDESDEPIVEDAFLTYYDTRLNQSHRNPEPRFYFPTTQVSQRTEEGDLLVLAKRRDGGILVIVAEAGSSAASQIEWLFGFSQEAFPKFSVRAELELEQDRIGFAATFILENIGIEVERSEQSYLDVMLERFGAVFPPTKEFSEYARSTLSDIDPRDDPDGALMAWMEREEILFRTLEKHIVGDWLKSSFTGEVEDFMKASLSIQNRRKSRAGSALEGHLAKVLTDLGIRFKNPGRTENNAKPDFLFPGQIEYHDAAFPAMSLTMLGVKTTCKDRWRQVLSEADRIPAKHLLTLETAISTNQTAEMVAKDLQLVVPRSLHASYNAAQQEWLFSLRDFTHFVSGKQR
jgi:hypothetical protein